ncbi:MAG: indolepyruvate oxidoreductase subunit beta [Treponema sp.]|nr:indolepyruvate oxidoreductase subunit beta [Treponema sp.]MCL2272351.1 indolepyruvate oxidoreductase subunit beta [Treponema sp.]
MKFDVILSGVGGQGVLSVASIIAHAALSEGFNVRQSEVHGMAQRGGAVLSHLRISDGEIACDLVPKGSADLVISMEPLESLRYISYLKPSGSLVTNTEPVKNIDNYPDIEKITSTIKSLPAWQLVDAENLAKEAGNAKTVNTVMVGAASRFLPVKAKTLEKTIIGVFSKKDANIIAANEKAFKLGQHSCKHNTAKK